ncbi:MAG: hypothetical protein R3251_03085 [Candidatus Spechtbacterales bacterium]|nr:hypothetical protein [Candidatus Spechtbacterales bacterium]
MYSSITLKTTCSTLHCDSEVHIPYYDIIEVVEHEKGGPGYYVFNCPRCKKRQKRPLDVFTINHLAQMGVEKRTELTHQEVEATVVQMAQEDCLVKFLVK